MKYSSKNTFIFNIFLMLSLFIWYMYKGNKAVTSIVFFIAVLILFLLMTLINFRDFMVIVNNGGIELHSIFRRTRKILWSDIKRIEVKKRYHGRLVGTTIVLSFYENDFVYGFNIFSLDKKKYFFEELMKNCISRNIEVIDLTSDEMQIISHIGKVVKNNSRGLLKNEKR